MDPIYRDGPLEVNYLEHIVLLNGVVVPITPIEWRLLCGFIEHKRMLLTFGHLAQIGWPNGREDSLQTDDEALKWHIPNLRRKLQLDNLLSVIGFGYKYMPREDV
jgi:DNA-binding response OmpR family regulator